MDEMKRINESAEGSEAPVTPEVPAEEPERKTGGKKKGPREKALILGIQKRKKGKAGPADGDGKGGKRSRYAVVQKRDIRYRGPLSYRHMMILGWLCIFLSQVSLLLSVAGEMDSRIAAASGGIVSIGGFAGSLFMPFLLLANFSKILSSKQQFKSMLLRFGGLSVAMGLALVLVNEHFVKGIADTAEKLAPETGEKFLVLFREHVFRDGYLAYNMFVDMFLCTLFMFFLMYHFKRPVWRGWVICFRLMAILPVAYEVTSIVLKALCKNGSITLPMYASPFLTTKPPMTFAAFIALALFIKRRERIFLKNDKSYEDYGHFLETNANSLHFSIHAAVTFIVAAVIDMVILVALTSFLTAGDVVSTGEAVEQVIENKDMLYGMVSRTLNVALAAGFGNSLVLIFFAPVALLFSYTKKYKNTSIDAFIPVIGIAAILALYVEAFFQAICQLPEILQMYTDSLMEKGLSSAGIDQLNLTEEETAQLMELFEQLTKQAP